MKHPIILELALLSTLGATLAQAQTSPEASFAARCAAAGVLVCEGWDNPAAFTPAVWPNSGSYPGDSGKFPIMDTAVKASGSSSMRLDVLSRSSSNGPGDWRQLFGQRFDCLFRPANQITHIAGLIGGQSRTVRKGYLAPPRRHFESRLLLVQGNLA